MRSHSISVTVDADVIRVEPETLVMTTRDEVRWTGTNARGFSIEFNDDGPFGGRRLTHAAATARQTPRNKGRFKYTVVSDENPGLRLDPVIVVDPPPTGGSQGGE
jgi:plastocyanin